MSSMDKDVEKTPMQVGRKREERNEKSVLNLSLWKSSQERCSTSRVVGFM